MKTNSSRREFLTMGLSLPLAGLTSTADLIKQSPQSASEALPGSSVKLSYRTLGRSGLKVTAVGFGCMITSDSSVIERAADLGINYFDTARGYQHGNNERMVGAALKRKRKDVVLSTKTHGGSKQSALTDLDTSLRELGTAYLDIWYLHSKDSPDEVTDELIEAQQIAKQQGKIRFAGVSTHSAKKLIPALVKNGLIDVVLVTYNFTMDKAMDAAIEQASQAGMGVVGMKVMAGGSRKVKSSDPLAPKLKRGGAMFAALKWVLRNPHVHTTIPSMTDMEQLEENLKAMAEPFTASDAKLLARQLELISPLYCRMCGECEGNCAQGLPVAAILRYLTYAEGYGQFPLGRERYRELPAAVSAVRCKQCPSCTVTCPFGVKVASRLTRAQELFA